VNTNIAKINGIESVFNFGKQLNRFKPEFAAIKFLNQGISTGSSRGSH